jgi:hypothetical protein
MLNSNVQTGKKARSKKVAAQVVDAALAASAEAVAQTETNAGVNHAELTKKVRGRAPNPESRQQKAFAFYAANPAMERKAFIAHCVTNLGLSKSGASTYYVNARKNLNK